MNNVSQASAWGDGAPSSRVNPFTAAFRLVGMLLSPFLPVLRAVWAATVFVLYLPLQLFLKLTPAGALARRLTHQTDAVVHLGRQARTLIDNPDITPEERLLICDRRREYAEMIAPPARFPTLYADVPEDLRRSIVSDGRLVNGDAPATRLAGATLDAAFVARAWESSVTVAIKAGYLALLAGIVLAFAAAFGASMLSGVAQGMNEMEMPVANDAPGGMGGSLAMDRYTAAAQYGDIWSDQDLQAIAEKVNVTDGSIATAFAAASKTEAFVGSLLKFVLLGAAAALMSAAVARFIWIGRFRFLVFNAANAAVVGLRQSWREALQRWRWRLVDRDLEAQAFADQVHFATRIDKSPLIELGESLGQLEFRGHLLAPQQGTPVRMSVVDMMQHVSVTGSSGEGKSRSVYVPLVRQLLALRQKGYPVAIYATDDKGAIGADIIDAAIAAKLPPEDVLVLGTGPNDWRVDLLDGLEPIEFSDIVKSVAKQAGGDGGDDFWPEMASDLLLNVATILQAAEHTSRGEEWVTKHGMRMYSVMNILRVASSDPEIEKALQIVADAMQDKEDQYRTIAHLDKNGLHSSLDYLVENWLSMVDATKDGIRANARKALRLFSFKDDIAKGYADGFGDKILPVSELLANKIKVVNISQIEHGSAGRLVAIMLKTLFFKQARAAEQRDPISAKNRLKWWFDPKPGEAGCDRYAINFFIADEYQALVTASRDDGLSDAAVWNVLRSAGIAGVLLTQSITAYKMAVGDKAADNMRSNWRTRIMLRTEDVPTIEEAKKLAGKVLRFNASDWHHMESAVAVRRETGVSAETLPRVQWDDQYEDIPVLFSPGEFGKFDVPGYEQAYNVDTRFIPVQTGFGAQGGDEVRTALQAAAWRQEDRTMGILQHGSSEVDAVRDEDLMQMGRGRALVFVQRAGGTRVEIIKLPNN
jgi:hypothetical protein